MALVAQASHELRGPLCAAQLGLSLIVDPSAQQRKAAIDLELRRATRTVDDLLSVRRGTSSVDFPTAHDLHTTVSDAVESCQPLAQRLGRKLEYRGVPTGVLVWADPVRVAQACGNLILNALEHGAGGVTVATMTTSLAVQVEVRDEGCGLSAALEQVQARPNRKSLEPRGHGLRVVAEVANRSGGRVFTSADKRNSITIEFPLAGACNQFEVAA